MLSAGSQPECRGNRHSRSSSPGTRSVLTLLANHGRFAEAETELAAAKPHAAPAGWAKAAARVARTVEAMTVLAVAIGVSSSLIGLTASYHLATPPGPTIALVTVAWFLTIACLQHLHSGLTAGRRGPARRRSTAA